MRYGSVCSGIEAASLAWEPIGWEPEWFAEIEAFPSAVLAYHWPHVMNHGDMLSLPDKVANDNAPAPDVLVGGTPCQAFSVAGRRGSLGDQRGALSLAFVELANAIDDVRGARGDEPCITVWENVPGVLSTKDNAFGCFLAGLAGDDKPVEPGPRPEPGRSSFHWRWEKKTRQHMPKWPDAGVVAGPRRTVAWRVLDAQYFGLAQRRRRVFVVGSARNGFDPGKVLLEWESLRRDSPPSRKAREEATSNAACGFATTGTLDARTQGGGFPGSDGACQGHVVPVAFGQNRQSGPVETSHALNAHAGPHGRQDFESETFLVQSVAGEISHTLKADGFDGSEDGTGRGVPTVGYRIAGDGAAYEEGDRIAPLTTGTDQNATTICFDTTQITSATNRSNPQPDAPCHPLAAQAHPPAIAGLKVRRLMPVECERLQGMPDGHTAINYRGKPAADGPRYKAIGNSMAVHCMRWIGRRIAMQLPANDNKGAS